MQLQTFYRIRFNHCDPFGHLNNSGYIDYMLNAREDHLRQFYQLDLDDFYKQGIGWVVSSHEIQYVRPANYNETVCIQSDLLEANDNNLLVEARMLNESGTTVKAVMWTRLTCINTRTGRKDNHSPEFLERLRSFVVTHINAQDGMKARMAALLGKPQPAGA
jgi:YbgC/YbaW family acyl-CoA thioester hydrolase